MLLLLLLAGLRARDAGQKKLSTKVQIKFRELFEIFLAGF